MMKIFKQLYLSVRCFYKQLTKEHTKLNREIRRKYKKKFLALRQTHVGERCFIIGNGPSLTTKDLDMLKNEYTFAANRVFYIFKNTDWRPTYYCAQDNVVIDDILDYLPEIKKNCDKMFLISDCYNKVGASMREDQNVLFFCAKYASAHKERLFSEKLEDYISGGGTITYAAIQIAVYMGFKEIYLIGVDHNYSAPVEKTGKGKVATGSSNNYFEGMPSNIKMTRPNTDGSTLSYIKAREYCDGHGIRIFNSTRGGKLEVFPRKRLEEILKNQ